MISLFGPTRHCEERQHEVQNVQNPWGNQRFLLSTKLQLRAGPSCGSADQQGGPVKTIGKRYVSEGGTCGNRGHSPKSIFAKGRMRVQKVQNPVENQRFLLSSKRSNGLPKNIEKEK